MSATTTQYLDSEGLSTFWGNIKKRITFHNMSGTAGTAGYVNFITVKGANYANHSLVVHILTRGYSSSTMEVIFNSANTTTPTVYTFRHLIQSFTGSNASTTTNVGYTYEDVDGIRYYKFWKKKNEGWGNISVHVDDDSYYVSNGLLTFPNEQSNDEPADIVWATYVWDSVPSVTSTAASAKKIGCNAQGQVVFGDALTASDVGAAPTSHASSATTYGVGTSANYGHVKLDNTTPLTLGTASTDGVATGKAHMHNAIESVARASVTTADLAHSGTNARAHMVLSQITSQTSTTHDPGDGYMLTFMWDGDAFDSQLYVPNGVAATVDYGRLKIRYRENASAWGDWGYLPTASKATLLTNADNLDNLKGGGVGNILGYYWESTSMPSNTAFSDNHGSQLLVLGTSGTQFAVQLEFRAAYGIYQRRLVSDTWGAWEKVLTSGDIPGSITSSDIDDIWASV